MKIYNSKDLKKLNKQLVEQFGFTGKLKGVFILKEKKQKLFMMTEEVALFPQESLRVEAAGMYIGAFFDNQFRLTIEGSQIIGPECTERIVEFDERQMQQWMQGESPDITVAEPGAFVLVKYNDDFLGCGKQTEDKLLNYIPKTRYIHALY